MQPSRVVVIKSFYLRSPIRMLTLTWWC